MTQTSIKAPAGQYLTRDLIRRIAPSVFAAEAHESRSDKYTYIPTIDVVEAMVKEGFAPVMVSQSRSRIPGKSEFTKHMLRFRHRNDLVKTAVVGETVNELVLVNSHDGTSSYQLTAGVFRFVCSNGMVVPANLVGDVKVPHRGNILDNVIEGSYRILDDMDEVGRSMDMLRATTLTLPEQRLLATSALALRYGRDENQNLLSPISADTALTSRRNDDRGDSAWKTFNRLQENLTKGGLRGRLSNGNRTSTREVTGIDSLVGLNKELWTLAQAMAELKQ